MKPAYTVTLGEKVYSHYPDEVLANLATEFLDFFQAANFKNRPDPRMHTFTPRVGEPLFISQRHYGGSIVSAAKGGVISMDFTRAVMQGCVFSQVPETEILIDELLTRAEKRGVAYDGDVALAYALSTEVSDFLDKYCVPPAINPDDLLENAKQMVQMLKIQR